MDILFKNQTTLNKSVTTETSKVLVNPLSQYVLLLLTLLYICLAIDRYLLKDYPSVLVYLFFILISLIIRSQLYRIHGIKDYKQQRVLFGDEDPTINITVFEDYLELSEDFLKANKNSLLISKNNLDASIPHNRITSVYKTKNLFVIIYGKQFALAIEKAKFTTGSYQAFEEFLLMKGIKVKQK